MFKTWELHDSSKRLTPEQIHITQSDLKTAILYNMKKILTVADWNYEGGNFPDAYPMNVTAEYDPAILGGAGGVDVWITYPDGEEMETRRVWIICEPEDLPDELDVVFEDEKALEAGRTW